MSLNSLKSLPVSAALATIMVALTFVGAAIPAQAQTYTVLDDLLVGGPGPQWPGGPLAQGRDGDLYGYSYLGGANNTGSMWKTTPSGTVSVVYNFASGTGNDCQTGLTLGTDGNFYGAALTNCTGAGYVFKLTPSGTLTVLHTFTGTPDGYNPGGLVQYTDGNFYGITVQGGANNFGSVFKITPAGTLTTLYSFDNVNNFANPTYGLTIGSDGNFYGTQVGGNGLGSIYKMTPAGVVTVLHSFTGNPDGVGPTSGIILGKDGNFYGVTQFGGTVGDGRVDQGTFFKMTPPGVVTILHNFNPATDYAVFPTSPLIQATDGNFYSTSNTCNEFLSCGSFVDIYKLTPSGTLTVVEKLTGTNGAGAYWTVTQDTNGTLYGITQQGGTVNGGVLFSVNISAAPFAKLVSTSGKVGSKIGILGQGFSASSVVKFNGLTATTVTRTGSTFLLATVPAGASNGYATVTTGTTTLTSSQKFLVHNSWASGAVISTPVNYPAGTGAVGTKIYVVGGATAAGNIATNQVYNTAANTWSTAAALPTALAGGSAAVVHNILYIFGGYSGKTAGSAVNNVWAYNPTTNTWSAKANMPTARGSSTAVVDGTVVYVIGGNGASLRLNTVEAYDTVANTWSAKSPLLTGKSDLAGGIQRATVLATDGYNAATGDNGDNEAYNTSTNSWTTVGADPHPRNSSCYGTVGTQLYIAGGVDNSNTPQTQHESYSATTNKWTTLATPAVATVGPGSAVAGGRLYCISGSSSSALGQGTLYSNVQIYQP